MWDRYGEEKIRSFCPPFLCSICQQTGHKAEMCPNGQVDWVAKLGNRAFQLRPNQLWSQDPLNPMNKCFTTISLESIEKNSWVYHSTKRIENKITKEEYFNFAAGTYNYKIEDMIEKEKTKTIKKAEQLTKISHINNQEVKNIGLPDGWNEVHDLHGRTYFWNKINNTTQWTRPTNVA